MLISIHGIGEFISQFGETTAPVRGEIELTLPPGGGTLSVLRFGLIGRGTPASVEGEPTGQFGFSGPSGGGTLIPQGENRWSLSTEIASFFNYEALSREVGLERVGPDRFLAPTEPFVGTLSGVLIDVEQIGAQNAVFSGELLLNSLGEGALRWVHRLRVALTRQPVWLLASPAEAEAGAPTFRRLLRVRPVGLRAGRSDPLPTGLHPETQFGEAKRIWGKCCIDLEVLATEVRDVEPSIKTSEDPEAVVNVFTDPDENTIEVFFVDNPLESFGGGAVCSCGWNTAKVVLTEHHGCNPHLLAHELGHVYAGIHPNASSLSTFFWEGEINTILEPALQDCQVNPDRNTLQNCLSARNPALISLPAVPCALRPDR